MLEWMRYRMGLQPTPALTGSLATRDVRKAHHALFLWFALQILTGLRRPHSLTRGAAHPESAVPPASGAMPLRHPCLSHGAAQLLVLRHPHLPGHRIDGLYLH